NAADLQQQGAILPHRRRGAQLLLAVGGPYGGDDHLFGAAPPLDAPRLLERDLVEVIDTQLDPFGDHAAAIGLHPDAHVVVHDALDADQDPFHGRSITAGPEALLT